MCRKNSRLHVDLRILALAHFSRYTEVGLAAATIPKPTVAQYAETITKWGLRGFLLPVSIPLHARVPATKCRAQIAVEGLCPHLEQEMRAARCPSHLLLLHHASADDLIHC